MNILAVEDNAEDAFLILQAFSSIEGCQAFVCRDVVEAKKYLQGDGMFANRRRHPLPDGIICDLGFSGESGLQFITWLRGQKEFETIPTFILSGALSKEDLQSARALGVLRVMQKPPDLRTLERTLAQLTEELSARLQGDTQYLALTH